MSPTGSSISSSRRSSGRTRLARAAAAVGAVLLAGCGFHPLYAPAADGGPGPAARALAAIDVAIIPDRAGQLLRQDLQAELHRGGRLPARYRLAVALRLADQGAGIQADTSTTYIRVIATATWTLRATAPPAPVVASGSASAVDGYDILDQQYFSADLEGRAATRRLAGALARQIATELAARLGRPGPAAAPAAR